MITKQKLLKRIQLCKAVLCVEFLLLLVQVQTITRVDFRYLHESVSEVYWVGCLDRSFIALTALLWRNIHFCGSTTFQTALILGKVVFSAARPENCSVM